MTRARAPRLLDRLGGLVISEERRLAGRMAGALYILGGLTALLLLVAPYVDRSHPELIVAMSVSGIVWGALCLTIVPWERASAVMSHLSTGMGFPLTALAVGITGGATSPARFFGLFILVYAAYFYRAREATPHVAGVIGLHALPLAYDAGAASSGFVAELIVIAPTYVVLAALLMGGKSVLVELRDRAQDLALHDALTGLANRRALMDELERHVGGRRAGDRLGLVLLDLDNFKDANTQFGHQAGDRVLQATARGLLGAARGTDMVARLGGDEFAVVALDVDEPAVRDLAERLVRSVRAACDELGLAGARVTASAGWASAPLDADNVEGLIAVADSAMRTAKLVGKDCAAAPLRLKMAA
jgi:diguanylate cyclase (GGDEF)-like protein